LFKFANALDKLIFTSDSGNMKELEDALKMTQGKLSNYASGTSLPQDDTLEKIAHGLGFSAEEYERWKSYVDADRDARRNKGRLALLRAIERRGHFHTRRARWMEAHNPTPDEDNAPASSPNGERLTRIEDTLEQQSELLKQLLEGRRPEAQEGRQSRPMLPDPTCCERMKTLVRKAYISRVDRGWAIHVCNGGDETLFPARRCPWCGERLPTDD
jgi:transcriptional regulator with XRE-family HTH domain